MTNLSFIITIYEQSFKELKYYIKHYNKYKNNFEFHFIIDNDSHPDKEKFEKNINNNNLHIHKNKGKFLSIYDLVREGKIKSNHIKVVDPDDYVLFWKFIDINLEKDNLYLFRNSIFNIKPFIKSKFYLNLVTKLNWGISDLNFPNNITILPTEYILNDNLFSGKTIRASDDKLLGYISVCNGARVKEINETFYYYVKLSGNTNPHNSLTFFRNALETFREILEIINKAINLSQKTKLHGTKKWFDNLYSKSTKLLKGDQLLEIEYLYKEIMLCIEEIENTLLRRGLLIH